VPIRERLTIGAEVKYSDYGNLTRSTLTTAGAFVTVNNAGAFAAHDIAAALGLGMRMGNWSWGVSARGISSKIDNATASGFAADLGLQARPERLPVQFGFVVKNLGSSMTYDRTKEDLPLLGRIGLSTSLMSDRLRFYADVEKARNEEVAFMGGGEFILARMLHLRAGYDGRNDAGSGLTLGLGITHKDLRLDYAYIPFGDFGENHRVGLRLLFGPWRTAPPPAATTVAARPATATTPCATAMPESAPAPATPAPAVSRAASTPSSVPAPSTPAPIALPPAAVQSAEALRIYVGEFTDRSGRGNDDGVEALRAELHAYLARAGQTVETPREARQVIMGEYWEQRNGSVLLAVTLNEGFSEQARHQVRTTVSALADPASRGKILMEIIAALTSKAMKL
jgi:hypothetical protein